MKREQGEQIKSLDEMMNQELIMFHGKVYHRGWFSGWQLGWTIIRIKFGEIFKLKEVY